MNLSALVITVLAVLVHCYLAQDCVPNACLREDGCVCPSTSSPINVNSTPQFVMLTFDEAVTEFLYSNYYRPILFGRNNSDGSPISATFFVPHEYSDYERVNQLYNAGFEIGVNSITKNPLNLYWLEANRTTLIAEFGGDRQLISNFANIPIASIKGARTPNLELLGNITFDAYNASGLTYDNSWPTLSTDPLFPYTLDTLSPQQCLVGFCPEELFPGFWVAPIVSIRSHDASECHVLSGCVVTGNASDIFDWLQGEFNRTYSGNRVPLPLLVNSAWFSLYEDAADALVMFLDYLASLPDVYVASISQVIDWMKDPVPVDNFTLVLAPRVAPCAAQTCALAFNEDEVRFMRTCVECPDRYPWLGNPLGQS